MKKKKRSKLRVVVGRILSCIFVIYSFAAVLLSIPISVYADGNTAEEMFTDSLMSNASLRVFATSSEYTFNSVNPVRPTSWSDYWRTLNGSAVGFTSSFSEDNGFSRHKIYFTNNVANSIFVGDVEFVLRDIYYLQNSQDASSFPYMIPYLSFIETSNARSMEIDFTITYELLTTNEQGSVLAREFTTDSFTVERPTREFAQVQIPLIPQYGGGNTIQNVSKHLDSGEDVRTHTDIIYVKELVVRIPAINPSWAVSDATDFNIILPTSRGENIECSPREYEEQFRVLGENISVDYSSWLVVAIGGFLNFELFPGIKLWYVLLIPLTASLVHAFLKIFAGG